MDSMPVRFVALVVLGAYVSLTCGCISNEYVIPRSELGRLAGLPPSQRGARVRVVQELGSRDDDSVDNGDALSAEAYADEYAGYDRPENVVDATMDLRLRWPPGDGYGGGMYGRGGRAGHPWTPSTGTKPMNRGSNKGGGNLNLGNLGGGGGGNGGGGDALLIVAVVIVAVAIMAAAGLAVTEGLRYDGVVQLHPEQPVHLKSRGGGESTLPLAALTPADVAATKEAVVKDDEAYGLRFIERRPLDREGFAFKVDFGSLDSLCACYSAAGFASNVQLGYFPHHRIGLLGTLTLGGGTSSLEHTFQRHSANIEAQFFPLSLWRFHLGGFGHGGMQIARDEFGTRTGPAWGGGAILEFALTTRLALSGRMDYTVARTAPENNDWASSSTFTAGLAIY
jgi:hypothetical protein